jgi:ubiquinone/menaquinone biosynthesis C-methylase UbiE
MNIQPRHNILDVGFGGGITLGLMVDKACQGKVAGIEVSTTLLMRAMKAYAKPIANGQLDLQKGPIEQIPFNEARFDSVCTVNTVYFWQDPKRAVAEAYRVLKPGGRFVLSFRPPEDMRKLEFTQHGFTLYDREVLAGFLDGAGFAQLHSIAGHDAHLAYVCMIAHKS